LAERNRDKKEDKCKHPLILFNVVNEKSRLATPNFPSASATASTISYEPTRSRRIADEAREPSKTASNHGLLRKLRLPLKDYQRMQWRRENEETRRRGEGGERSLVLRSESKAKSLFTLTSGKPFFEPTEEEAFVRYENQD
jgi:hypothetical protein